MNDEKEDDKSISCKIMEFNAPISFEEFEEAIEEIHEIRSEIISIKEILSKVFKGLV